MSWATTLIISAATVKETANLEQSVEDRKLTDAIRDAQHELKEMLGQTLYDLVEDADPVGDPTLGGDAGLQTLYNEHCKFFLSNKAKEVAYPEMWGSATRNGVHQRSGSDYNSIDSRGLSILQGVPRSRAESYAGELLRYIKGLASDNAIRIAYDTCVQNEPRTTEVKNTGRIITRISRWQYPEGSPRRNRYDDGY
jgi:hypothetical protein